jgi:RhtB (resistance to homoserine/threonine) family protein
MEYLPIIGTITLIHLLAVISPGPDFIVSVKNSLTYSRKIGIWTAVGFGLGITIHIFYSLAGLALVISKSILLFNIIKLLGAAYLIYIGVQSLLSKSSKLDIGNNIEKEEISIFSAIKIGFLTNVLNPKATLFFLSLFTFIISPGTPLSVLLIASAIMVINTFLWFSFVATVMTQNKIRSLFERFQGVFNKTLGGMLILLGVKVALTRK